MKYRRPVTYNRLCNFSEIGVIKMSHHETEQTEQGNDEVRNDPAFGVIEINIATGETFFVVQKGIMGACANQFKNTSNRRKGSGILRKLGYVMAACGDVQYGKDIKETDLDPALVTDQIEE